jgi:hypothetical protein
MGIIEFAIEPDSVPGVEIQRDIESNLCIDGTLHVLVWCYLSTKETNYMSFFLIYLTDFFFVAS